MSRMHNFCSKMCLFISSKFVGCLLYLLPISKQCLVIGDSHSKVFLYPSLSYRFFPCFFEVCSVVGATASGIDNPNSSTQALPIFTEKIDSYSKRGGEKVCVLLGEIDSGFLIFLKAQKTGKDPKLILGEVVKKYCLFLRSLKGRGLKVICISAPLPTIADGVELGSVANFRKEVKATQVERTSLTRLFNENVKEYCETIGIDYLMLDQASIGEDGLVADHLLNENPADHHYSNASYSKLISQNFPKEWLCQD